MIPSQSLGPYTILALVLLPGLLVSSITYAASRPWTIFRSQVKNRIDSPGHAGEFFVDVLQRITVADLTDRVRRVVMIPEEMRFVDFKRYFTQTKQHYFTVQEMKAAV